MLKTAVTVFVCFQYDPAGPLMVDPGVQPVAVAIGVIEGHDSIHSQFCFPHIWIGLQGNTAFVAVVPAEPVILHHAFEAEVPSGGVVILVIVRADEVGTGIQQLIVHHEKVIRGLFQSQLLQFVQLSVCVIHTGNRSAAASDPADHLSGVLTVAAVNVDQILRLVEYTVAELTALVVVCRTDENDLLLDDGFPVVPAPCLRCFPLHRRRRIQEACRTGMRNPFFQAPSLKARQVLLGASVLLRQCPWETGKAEAQQTPCFLQEA